MTDEEILKAFNKKRKEEREKIVVRPTFALRRESLTIAACLIVIAATVFFRSAFSGTLFAVVLCAELVLFFAMQTKSVLLLLIFLYQRFAPAAVRGVCLFTPSCSEYTRLSIIKYGAFRGAIKGFNRLRRCRPPNGGFDEP